MGERIMMQKLAPAVCMPRKMRKRRGPLTRGWQAFPIKHQTVNIFGFAAQTISVEITELHYSRIKEAGNTKTNECGYLLIKHYSQKQEVGQVLPATGALHSWPLLPSPVVFAAPCIHTKLSGFRVWVGKEAGEDFSAKFYLRISL